MDCVALKLGILDAVRKKLQLAHLWVGDTIWVLHAGCYGCPLEQPGCGDGCVRKGVLYIEPIVIANIDIQFRGGQVSIDIKDESNTIVQPVSNEGITFFTDREAAIEYLTKRRKDELHE